MNQFKNLLLKTVLKNQSGFNSIKKEINVIFFKKLIMSNTEIQSKIDELKSKLSGDMMSDMELRDQIHNLEMTLNGVKPEDSHFDCIGCGS